jgi:hypothetical protein
MVLDTYNVLVRECAWGVHKENKSNEKREKGMCQKYHHMFERESAEPGRVTSSFSSGSKGGVGDKTWEKWEEM